MPPWQQCQALPRQERDRHSPRPHRRSSDSKLAIREMSVWGTGAHRRGTLHSLGWRQGERGVGMGLREGSQGT